MKNLIHTQTGKVFEVKGTSIASSSTKEIVGAHISNFFNKNKSKVKGNPDTQSGFIIDRMVKNLLSCISYNEARFKTIEEFELKEI